MPAFIKALKYIGYYVLIALYYLIVFSILLFTFESPYSHEGVNAIGLFISLCCICSPFFMVKLIINKLYPGSNKRQHAVVLLVACITLLILHATGVNNRNGLSIKILPYYIFDVFLFTSLYIYKPKGYVAKINKSVDTKEPIKETAQPELVYEHRKLLTKAAKNKIYIALAILLLLLIITNPSVSTFREHQGLSSYKGLSREYNLFICSIYEDYNSYQRYIGICGNFFEI